MGILSSGKTSLQFDFNPESLERLDNLVGASGAKMRAEVIRSSMRLFEWFIDEIGPDYTITVTDPDGNIVSLFKGSHFRRALPS